MDTTYIFKWTTAKMHPKGKKINKKRTKTAEKMNRPKGGEKIPKIDLSGPLT